LRLAGAEGELLRYRLLGDGHMDTSSDFIEIRGEHVILRDSRPEDVGARLRWSTVETAWQDWDGPSEGKVITPPERIAAARRKLRREIAKPLPSPRSRLFIERVGGPLLGWVSRYHDDAINRTTWVGINVCESAFWNQGLGTEALRLWIAYLFREWATTTSTGSGQATVAPSNGGPGIQANSGLHRIGTETWSGNERMIRCAEKCGFMPEGRFRESVEVRGQRYDGVKLGLLRREWEAGR
jgi:RimJ/RimL family protein N-acetyltransferase